MGADVVAWPSSSGLERLLTLGKRSALLAVGVGTQRGKLRLVAAFVAIAVAVRLLVMLMYRACGGRVRCDI
jgi:hypothetical protein